MRAEIFANFAQQSKTAKMSAARARAAVDY